MCGQHYGCTSHVHHLQPGADLGPNFWNQLESVLFDSVDISVKFNININILTLILTPNTFTTLVLTCYTVIPLLLTLMSMSMLIN